MKPTGRAHTSKFAVQAKAATHGKRLRAKTENGNRSSEYGNDPS
jgi:hypothetical protein